MGIINARNPYLIFELQRFSNLLMQSSCLKNKHKYAHWDERLHTRFLKLFLGYWHNAHICRNKRKYMGGDEVSTCQGMEGLQVVNGLECKIACSSSKVGVKDNVCTSSIPYLNCSKLFEIVLLWQVSYVLDTEDLLFRRKRRSLHWNTACNDQAKSSNGCSLRVERFHRLLSSS